LKLRVLEKDAYLGCEFLSLSLPLRTRRIGSGRGRTGGGGGGTKSQIQSLFDERASALLATHGATSSAAMIEKTPDGEKCGAAACSVLVVFVGGGCFPLCYALMLFSPFSFLFSRVFCAWESESLR
jgi:hypothetical protein